MVARSALLLLLVAEVVATVVVMVVMMTGMMMMTMMVVSLAGLTTGGVSVAVDVVSIISGIGVVCLTAAVVMTLRLDMFRRWLLNIDWTITVVDEIV